MNKKSVIVGADGQPLAFDTAHHAASSTARELSSWNPVPGSPDSDLLDELTTLVSRSRDLVRNHGVASGAVQTLVDNVVGSGLRLAATPDFSALGMSRDQAVLWSRKTEALWRSWANTTDCDVTRRLTFNGMTAQVFRSCLVNGEGLALPLWLSERRDRAFSLVFQLVEPDRLDTPPSMVSNRRIRGGIEVDAYGAPVAYWISKTHPGDHFINGFSSSVVYQRIPARTSFGRLRVIHVYDHDRPGQRRGKPVLSSVMPLFKMLDHYERSELQAAVVNAMIAAFVETPLDSEAISELFGGSAEDYISARNEWQVKLQGGAVIPVFPGDKIAPFTPSRPNSGYGSFVDSIYRHIGAGLNLPPELLTKDFTRTNYSSARAALLEAWRFFVGRRNWLSTCWAQPVYELWLEEAVNRGYIYAPGFYDNRALWTRCKWIGPGRGWIDPVKEAQASRIRMEIGLSTLEDECASQGLDWEEVLEQSSRERARMRELDLPFPVATVAGSDSGDAERADDSDG